MIGLLLMACGGTGSIVLLGDDTGELPATEPVSTFTAGRYWTTSLVVLDEGVGQDLDGDGAVDNQAPTLLALLDPFTDDDMSQDGVNASLVEMLDAEELILLLDASHTDGTLAIDLLLASRDEETGALAMDPASTNGGGGATSHFVGAFSDEFDFSTTTASADLPFPVVRGDPPVLIPMAEASLLGSLGDGAALGMIVGGLPVAGLITQVVDPLVPPAGPDGAYDPDDFLGMSRPDFMDWVEVLLEENIADLWLEDGSRAISAALSWEVEAATEWPD